MMNRPTTSAGPEAHLRTMRILWGSFLVCVGLFVLITILTRPADLPAGVSGDLHPMLYVLAIAALVLVVVSFVVRGFFYGRAAQHQQPMLVQGGFIFAMALCEAGVLMGLVGIFATRNDAAYLLFALGALGMLLHFPRREQIEAAYHKTLR